MARILVVRHGESTWNAAGRVQGHADPPLSGLGERQAEAAARSPLLVAVERVWSSDLARARVTADLIATARGLEAVADSRWRERSTGTWTGMTRAEIEAVAPGGFSRGPRPPGWEDDASVLTRALAVLAELASAVGDGDALVVSHSGVLRTLERRLGAPPEPVPNLGGRFFELTGERPPALGARIVLVDPDDVEVTIPGQM